VEAEKAKAFHDVSGPLDFLKKLNVCYMLYLFQELFIPSQG